MENLGIKPKIADHDYHQNTVYRYEVNRLPEETIEFVDYDIIVYPPEI